VVRFRRYEMAGAVKKTISLPPDLVRIAEEIAREEGNLKRCRPGSTKAAQKTKIQGRIQIHSELLVSRGAGKGDPYRRGP